MRFPLSFYCCRRDAPSAVGSFPLPSLRWVVLLPSTGDEPMWPGRCRTCSRGLRRLECASCVLERALGSQHGSLRKAKDRIERNVLFQVLLHHPAAFLGRQGWLQDVLCLICYMKLFQRVSISPLAFTTVSDIRGAGNVKNVLVALAQQGLHHEECHDVIVHAYL